MALDIQVKIVNQLTDNYSYIIYSLTEKEAIVVDPAESQPILEYLEKNNLSLKAILITHHHSDHTSGIKDLLSQKKTEIYSPNPKILETTKLIKDKDRIILNFIDFIIIATPGHTLDHVVFHNKKNNLLFSGDTLFSLGCGRIFEGNYDQMFQSLQTINNLPDETIVYCGHEYTFHNYNFLCSIFSNNDALKKYKYKIDDYFNKTNRTIPFKLGDEKIANPFLVSRVNAYNVFMQANNMNEFSFFKYLRSLKDNF
jgi:hydroxyacylglutathione hydrolase